MGLAISRSGPNPMRSLPAQVRLPSRVPASPPCCCSRLASPRLASPRLADPLHRYMACFCCVCCGQSMGVVPVSAGCSGCDAVHHSCQMQCGGGVVWCGVLCRCVLWRDGCGMKSPLIYPKRPGVTKSGCRAYASPLPTFRATWLGYNYQRIYCRGTGAHPSGLTAYLQLMTWL